MSRCARCGAAFSCAVSDGRAAPCWCMALPALLPLPAAQDDAGADAACWCEACLRAELAQRRQAAAPD